MTLIELMIAACVLVLASLSLAYAFSTSGLASRLSDTALNVRSALTSTQETISDVPYEQLFAWNGLTVQTGPDQKLRTLDDAHPSEPGLVVSTTVTQVRVGLLLVEHTIADEDGTVLSRTATYRSGEY